MSQNKDIPHVDLIRAVLDGKVTEYRKDERCHWSEFIAMASAISCMANFPDWQYRLKPEPHKWQREMDAQAAGKMIQYRDDDQTWTDGELWSFDSPMPGAEYRIKPVTKEQALEALRNIVAKGVWANDDEEILRQQFCTAHLKGVPGVWANDDEENLRRFIEEAP